MFGLHEREEAGSGTRLQSLARIETKSLVCATLGHCVMLQESDGLLHWVDAVNMMLVISMDFAGEVYSILLRRMIGKHIIEQYNASQRRSP